VAILPANIITKLELGIVFNRSSTLHIGLKMDSAHWGKNRILFLLIPFSIIESIKPRDETRIKSHRLYINLTIGNIRFSMKPGILFAPATTLSGQRSRTQKQIGIFFTFLINIAGRQTVIGEGSKTKIISNFLFNKKNEVNMLPNINDI
jgi:hypothetical protein